MKPLHVRLWLAGGATYSAATLALIYAIFFAGVDDRATSAVTTHYQAQVSKLEAKAQKASGEFEMDPRSAPIAEPVSTPDIIPRSTLPGMAVVPNAAPPIVTDWHPPEVAAKSDEGVSRVTKSASVRSGPSTADPIVGTSTAGSIVEVKEVQSGWLRIDRTSGQHGWVYSDFISSAHDGAPVQEARVPDTNNATPRVEQVKSDAVKKRTRNRVIEKARAEEGQRHPRAGGIDEGAANESEGIALVTPPPRLGLLQRFRERRGQQVVVNH